MMGLRLLCSLTLGYHLSLLQSFGMEGGFSRSTVRREARLTAPGAGALPAVAPLNAARTAQRAIPTSCKN
jgi:hypothetical protein